MSDDDQNDVDLVLCSRKGCERRIDWLYDPAPELQGYCDVHVPRGCDCNHEEHPRSPFLDRKGRREPCVEYHDLIMIRQQEAIERLEERAKTDKEAALLLGAIRDNEHALEYWVGEVQALEEFHSDEEEEDVDPNEYWN